MSNVLRPIGKIVESPHMCTGGELVANPELKAEDYTCIYAKLGYVCGAGFRRDTEGVTVLDPSENPTLCLKEEPAFMAAKAAEDANRITLSYVP